MSFGFLEGFNNKLRNIFRSDWLGIYLTSDYKIFLCGTPFDKPAPFQLQDANFASQQYDVLVNSVITEVQKKCKRWPPPHIFFCNSLDAPSLSTDFFKKITAQQSVNMYPTDCKMPAAIGAGMNVTDFSKQLVIAMVENTIHSYLVFASCIYYYESAPISSSDSLQEALNAQIARIDAGIEPDLPTHFKNINLGEDEINQINSGWAKPCSEQLFLIGSPSVLIDIDKEIRGYKIVSCEGLDECIVSGMDTIIKGVSQLPAGTRIGKKD
ncbi:hypothetical protein Gbem_1913 [Citrifermentans bemidjiense Bem]|uniref:Uncharacterized protein n=1 Tax=Citrifermentans bemidjiense (strain ATCC BAA-1014 / DSM 16622 / JCM 12645 / Bem) TaxID=404380 RepID=B5EB66_CITBB|nr:hypothetical protein [Citrifermentans bemidjiense]ACH38927.1 hypothetical protein Gbem_1913 [Citrifermentans bemidjiense Bem]